MWDPYACWKRRALNAKEPCGAAPSRTVSFWTRCYTRRCGKSQTAAEKSWESRSPSTRTEVLGRDDNNSERAWARALAALEASSRGLPYQAGDIYDLR